MNSLKILNIIIGAVVIIFSSLAIYVSISQKLHPQIIIIISSIAIVMGVLDIVKNINTKKLIAS